MGVLLAFRTGFAQGISDNLRKKIASLGFTLSHWQFFFGDHVCHTLPPVVLTALLVRRRQRVSYTNVLYAITLSTWFAFRQQAKLDSSGVYVPHPWRRTWIAIITGFSATPSLVDGLIDRNKRQLILVTLVLFAPWATTRLDPGLRAKYTFEYAVASVLADSPKPNELETFSPRKPGGCMP